MFPCPPAAQHGYGYRSTLPLILLELTEYANSKSRGMINAVGDIPSPEHRAISGVFAMRARIKAPGIVYRFLNPMHFSKVALMAEYIYIYRYKYWLLSLMIVLESHIGGAFQYWNECMFFPLRETSPTIARIW